MATGVKPDLLPFARWLALDDANYSVALALGDPPSSWQQPRTMHPSQLPSHRLDGNITLSTMAVGAAVVSEQGAYDGPRN